MSLIPKYKNDVNEAIKFFRPVLASLNIRNPNRHNWVFLADFDNLDLLNVENCLVSVKVADLQDVEGMFFCRYDGELVYCYIIINNVFHNLEKVKVIGIHEFCHFLAIVYMLASVSIDLQKKQLSERMDRKIDKLNKPNAELLVQALNLMKPNNEIPFDLPELLDSHFRLDCEDMNINYVELFYNLLFSREMFEEYFDSEKQNEFLGYIKQENIECASQYIIDAIKVVAANKSIAFKFAYTQVLTWITEYLK